MRRVFLDLAKSFGENFSGDSMTASSVGPMRDDLPEKQSDAELPIARSAAEVFAYALLWSLVAAFVGIAIFHVSRPTVTPVWALAASVAWLLLVGATLAMACLEEGGPRQFLINRLGDFSTRQFIWIEWRENEPPNVCFGFEKWGRRWRHLTVRLDGIAKVRWNSGQGTAMAGHDLNDWSVAVWFDKRKTSITPPDRRYRDRLYIVGPSGPKETVEEFGLDLVKFLCSAGATLVRTKDGCTFRRTRRVAHEDPSAG